MQNNIKESWPALDYAQFKSTSYLLHMGVQAMGKLKLVTPFESHWANVALWLTARGLTTGLIPYQQEVFSIDLDMIDHQVIVKTSTGCHEHFNLTNMSVAEFTQTLFSLLQKCQIFLTINSMPQEIVNPIPFEQDIQQQFYDKALAHAWWRILLKTYWVMRRYHARFDGETPSIGLMWGTFDLRDARYNGMPQQTTGINAGFIRRNAMNEAQVEVGFWPGNEAYPKPAYYSFIYPEPAGIQQSQIKPSKAHWNKTLMEFILDYDEIKQSQHPEQDLLDFFESTYQAGATLGKWDPKLLTIGKPI